MTDRQASDRRRLKMFLQLTAGEATKHGIDASDLLQVGLTAVDDGDYQTAVDQMKAIKARLETKRDTWQVAAADGDEEIPF